MLRLVSSERIKLTSTRSPWWCTVVLIVLAPGITALASWAWKNQVKADNFAVGRFGPGAAVSGVTGFGMYVLMIMAALAITNEYRFGIIRTTFQAVPNRSRVLAAKTLLIGVFGAILAFLLGLACLFLARFVAGAHTKGVHLELSEDHAWRTLLGVPVYALLCITLAIALGTLLRQSAITISLLILWPLLIEGLFNLFGSFGRNVIPFLPFANAQLFLTNGETGTVGPGPHWHWGPWGGISYFAGFVAVITVAAVVAVNKRDA